MTDIHGGDYATANPAPNALVKAGWRFAARYLRDLVKTNGDKSLTVAEANALKAVGIDLVSNEETDGRQGLRGFDGGVFDATKAHQAHVALGAPKERPIYFSPWDHDDALLTPQQKDTLMAYLRGCGQVLGLYRVGFYGPVALVAEAFNRQIITYGWEAAGWRKGHPIDPRTHIVQHVSAAWQIPGTDADTAIKVDYGQWGYRRPIVRHPFTGFGKGSDPMMPILVRQENDSAVFLRCPDGKLLHIDTDNLRAYAEIYGVSEGVMRDAVIDVAANDPMWA